VGGSGALIPHARAVSARIAIKGISLRYIKKNLLRLLPKEVYGKMLGEVAGKE
jgi:hypothetical protein